MVLKHRAALPAACLMVFGLTVGQSQAQTPASALPPKAVITHEKLWMMKRVGAPTVSPDGKWVIFSVLEPSYEADKDVSDLWIAASDLPCWRKNEKHRGGNSADDGERKYAPVELNVHST